MTRDEFEAAVWAVLSLRDRRIAYAIPSTSARAVLDRELITTILTAADTYVTAETAAALGEIDRARRSTVTHYGPLGGWSACSRTDGPGAMTASLDAVTCRSCKRTIPYRDALAQKPPGRPLHYIPLDDQDGEFACHPRGEATATTALAEVTCPGCKGRPAYLQDLATETATP